MLVGLSALGASTAAEPSDPFESEQVTSTLEALGDAAQEEAAPDSEVRSDGSESSGEASELFEEAFGGVVVEPTGLLARGARVERYVGSHAARLSVAGSRSARLAVSALPLRARDRSGRLAPVDLALRRGRRFLVPANPLVRTRLPMRLSDGIRVGDDGLRVLPAGRQARASARSRQRGRLVSNRAFHFEVARDTDWLVGAVPTGAELLLQLRSAAAPIRHPLAIEPPSGARLRMTRGGGVEIVRAGEVVSRILPPAAMDAAGRTVRVRYALEGRRLSVVVAHRQRRAAYPVLVDPVIEDWATDGQGGTNSWFTNPALDQLGWEFQSSQGGQFEGARQGNQIASYGTPPGRGLYVFGKPNTQRLLGDYGYWRWRVPGQTTYISRADFRTMYFQPFAAPGLPAAAAGLWDTQRTFFSGLKVFPYRLAGANTTVRPGDNIPGADPKGADEALFGMALLGSNLGPKWLHAYLGGAVIYLDDPEPASITGTDSPAGWLGADDKVTVNAADPGLGVRSIELQTPAGTLTRSQGCLGNRLSRCPASWSQSFDAAELPEGRAIPLSATATDALGKRSTPQTAQIDVDRSAPTLELSGSLRDAADGQIGDDPLDLHIRARDGEGQTSGVASVELLVDGQRRDYTEQTCEQGGCQLERDFTLDPSTLGEGSHEVTVKALDVAGNLVEESWTITSDRTAPTVALSGAFWERRDEWLDDGELSLSVDGTDAGSGVTSAELVIDGVREKLTEQPCPDGGCPLRADWTVNVGALDEGRHLVQVLVLDRAGRLAQESWTAVVDRSAPALELSGPLTESDGGEVSADAELNVSASDGGAGLGSIEILLDGARKELREQPCQDGGCPMELDWTLLVGELSDGPHTVEIVARDHAGRTASRRLNFDVGTQGPLQAPTLDRTEATPFAEQTSFIYEGPQAVQNGVADGVIDARRAAVVRGNVSLPSGEPLAGVQVTVAGHPEYGETTSRADGNFYLAVNGGEPLTVNLRRRGFLPADRQVAVPWQGYAWADDTRLVPLDPGVDTIEAGAGETQVARGAAVTDADGTRQATLIFAPDTYAEMRLRDGTVQPLSELNVRATEFTVGAAGREAMPADLPPASAYTYAVEYSVDEALAAGATRVDFDAPVAAYTDNFLDFRVGESVPVGYYDRQAARWMPAPNGRVIAIVGESDGLAELDLTGAGAAATADELGGLGIAEDERRVLGDLYGPGDSLWRVEVDHFTPYDFNWGFGLPADARGPYDLYPELARFLDRNCEGCGSIIGVEDQTLAEDVFLPGVPFGLHYQSGRAQGRRDAFTVEVKVTGDDIPASMRGARAEVEIAGRRFVANFPAAPNQTFTVQWDGRDAFGRRLQGAQPVRSEVGYVYDADYSSTARFAVPGDFGVTVSPSQRTVSITRADETVVGVLDAEASGLGGWTLDEHHAYDPVAKVLHYGDGTRRSIDGQALGASTRTVAGTGEQGYAGDGASARQALLDGPLGVQATADGSVLVADTGNLRVRRVSRDGRITTVAGDGTYDGVGGAGDGGPATAAQVRPDDLAVGTDGDFFILDGAEGRVRRVDRDGQISTVAGGGEGPGPGPCDPGAPFCCPDGCPTVTSLARSPLDDGRSARLAADAAGPERATELFLDNPTAIATSTDGALYIADAGRAHVVRVATDGSYDVVAGTGQPGFSGDGGSAVDAELSNWIDELAVAPDGALLIADVWNARVRRVSPDGRIDTIAGGGARPVDADGVPAHEADLGLPTALAVRPDGRIVIGNTDGRVFELAADGRVSHLAGSGESGEREDGSSLRETSLGEIGELAVAPDGEIVVAEANRHRVRRFASPLPGFTGDGIAIASEDGTELYEFDPAGRHLRTLSALTGDLILRFAYDDAGRLREIIDAYGDITRVERSAAGTPLALVGPFGERVDLEVDASDRLSAVTDAAGHKTSFEYAAGGLLKTLTDPRGNSWRYEYDAAGRLTREQDPDGGVQTLAPRSGGGRGVELRNGEGRGSVQRVEHAGDGIRRTAQDGSLVVSARERGDGSETMALPDGSTVESTSASDPRFGLQAPYTGRQTVRTPGGLVLVTETDRIAELADLDDPFSLTRLVERFKLNDKTATSTYDAATRTQLEQSPEGRRVVTRFDEFGKPREHEIAGAHPVQSVYDERGRRTTVRQAEREISWTYDAAGNVRTHTDILGRTGTADYDPIGQLTRFELPGERTVSYDYDPNGNLTALTPPGRPAHRFAYSATGLLERSEAPATDNSGPAVTRYDYNRAHELTRIARPDGSEILLGYDDAGRLTRVTGPDAVRGFGYDPATGRQMSLEGPGGQRLEVEYDAGLPIAYRASGPVPGAVNFEYNDDFEVAASSVGEGEPVSFGYDADGRLTAAGELTLARDPDNGDLIGTSLGQITTDYGFDAYRELGVIDVSGPDGRLFRQETERDIGGRAIAETFTTPDGVTSRSYAYDDAGQLADVREDGALAAHYEYDANGNRTLERRPGEPDVEASFDARDRLIRRGQTVYEYTPNGDLRSRRDTSSGERTLYDYNAFGDLTAVEVADGTRIEYVVDGAGARVGRKRNGEYTHRFVYGGHLGPAAEVEADGSVRTLFVYGTLDHVPDYMVRDGRTYRLITDRLGSVRLVVDASTGEVAQAIDYDPWGRVTTDSAPGFQPFGFGGGLYDPATGLVRLGARDYDPETGRWTTPDPLGFESRDTNLYAYVANDPVNSSDPVGLGVFGDIGSFISDASYCGLNSASFGSLDKLAGADEGIDSAGCKAGEIAANANPKGLATAAGRSAVKFGANKSARKRLTKNQRKGRRAERIAGADRVKTRIDCPSGTARYPDMYDPRAKTIGEVKSVNHLSYTAQLRDYVGFAQQKGFTFTLYVRKAVPPFSKSTTFSGPLQQAIDEGHIKVKRSPFFF